MTANRKKTLIVYFSASENTRFVAQTMAGYCDADIAALVPKKQMHISGIGYFGWGVRQLLRKEGRELAPLPYSIDAYDLIIVGTPVWTFTMTPPVRTFLRENDFDGKNIAFFCCHGGNHAHTLDDMQAAVPRSHILGTIDFRNALAQDKAAVASKAEKWITSLL